MSSYIAITGCLSSDPTKPKLAGVHTRWEISELQANHKEQFDLLIRAWANLQARPERDSQSFYAISSIHGIPYIPWPFKPEDSPKSTEKTVGYCQHRSVLFPTWHRPYMLLLEQNLQKEAMVLAKQFVGHSREIYVNAAEKLRLPYWDWASSSFLPRAVLYDQLLVPFPGPNGSVVRERIPNPLLKYRFTNELLREKYFIDRNQDGTSQEWTKYPETMRCPDEKGTSQHDVCDAQLANNQTVLRDSVFKLMNVKDYTSFSNTSQKADLTKEELRALSYQSLEGIHDSIHVLCGIDPSPLDGHMGDPDYAGYDPLFWLHHSNVDRLYAIWQSLHPGVGVTLQNTSDGKKQNNKTPLYPFRGRGGEVYTSEPFEHWDSIFNFGYTYPELPAKLMNQADQNVLKTFATKQVNRMYGPSNKDYPPVPRAAIIEANERLRGGSRVFDLGADHHREYVVNIRIRNFAVDGSFFVHIILGDFDHKSLEWAQETNLVGSHCIFSTRIGETACGNCLQDHRDNIVVSGAITLTDALLRKGLPDLEPDNTTPYLKENLHWIIQAAKGDKVDIATLPSLKISVECTVVETCADSTQLPFWGLPQTLVDVTSGRPGGYNSGDNY